MSLLNFIRKSKNAKDIESEDVAANAPVSDSAAPEGETPIEAGSDQAAPAEADTLESKALSLPPSNGSKKLNLDEIRSALDKIAEIIRDDEERERQQEAASGNFTSVDFSIHQIAELAPQLFRTPAELSSEGGPHVNVLIDNLYEQLGSGKVSTTVGRLLAEVDEDLLAPNYVESRNDTISIPLHLVVSSVRPDELMKRTAAAGSEVSLEDMPNLFNPPSAPVPQQTLAIEGDDLMTGAPPAAVTPEPQPEPEVAPEPEADEEAVAESAAPEPAAEQDDPIFQRAAYRETGLKPPEPRLGSRIPFETPEPAEDEPKHDNGTRFEIDDSVSVFKLAGQDDAVESDELPVADETPEVADEPEPPVDETPEPEIAPEPEPVVEPAMQATQSVEIVEPDEIHEAAENTVEPAVAAAGTVLHGIDLNVATAAELADGLDGVGDRLAARLVRYREQHGDFRSMDDLTKVPGVGPSTFAKITGRSWSEARDNVLRTLRFLLGDDQDKMPDLKVAAERFTQMPGFKGCIFTHEDGHVLAAKWDHPSQDVLGAVVPQMFKKLVPYVEQINLGELSPMTLFLGETAVTVVQSGDMYLALVHGLSRLNKRQIQLIQLVGTELENRLERAKAMS